MAEREYSIVIDLIATVKGSADTIHHPANMITIKNVGGKASGDIA